MSMDRNGEFSAVSILPNAVFTTNGNSTGVDVSAYDGVLKLQYDVSAITAGDNDSTYTGVIYHSDEASANYTSAGLSNISASNIAAFGSIGIDTREVKKYIRINSNKTGANSPSRSVSVVAFGKLKDT